MKTLPNISALSAEALQNKIDALVTEVQANRANSFLGSLYPTQKQRVIIRHFSFQSRFNDPILSLFDAAGVACPHKRNMADALTMAVNYALNPAADYTVGELAKALGLSGKILTSDTPISEKCKSRCLTPNRVLRILGKECTNIGLQSAKAIGYFSAANIIARKSITGACDDHAYTYVSYSDGDTYQIKTAFVQGETVFSFDSLSSLAGAKRLTPFALSAEDEAKCGFYLGITAKQIREYTDDAIANKKHNKVDLALLACLSGFTSYVDEWEELNAYAFEFLELNKALETAKTIEAAKASAEGVTAPEQAPAVETADKALESAGTEPAKPVVTDKFCFCFGECLNDAAGMAATLFHDSKTAPKGIDVGQIVSKGAYLGSFLRRANLTTIGELAEILGISGEITKSADYFGKVVLDRREKEKAVRKARGKDEELPACQRVNNCMDADHLCTYLGKTYGTLGAGSAKGLGYFAAAFYLAIKTASPFAADHLYFYSNRKSPIRTGFVNGQTVFSLFSFPSFSNCGIARAFDQEYQSAGGKLLHLTEEQIAKCGFEWGVTADQLLDFAAKAPDLKLDFGGKLYDKAALNYINCVTAFAHYISEWEKVNREAFEEIEAAGSAESSAPEAVTTAEPANEIEPAGSTEAPAESAPAVKSAGAENSAAHESEESAGTTSDEPAKATESAGAAEQADAQAPLVSYFGELLSEDTEQEDGPELNNESALQDYFKGMLADDTISGPYESTGAVLAPAGSAALTEPATAPILFPETAIAVNKEAPNIFRAVSAGLCTIAPKFSTDEPEPEALEATPLEAAGAGPLAPELGQIEHLSFEYFGHRYQLDYSNEGWRWTFDDYKDQCGRGFCFKADGMTLAQMLKAGLLGTDARYLGELVAYVENEHQINLGQFACKDLEEATYGYICGRGFSFGAECSPAAKLLGVKIYLPVYKSHGRMNLESRFEQADWQIDIAAYSVQLLCSAGFSKANAAEFVKGWTNAILWHAEEELSRTAGSSNEAPEPDDFDDIPF